MPGKKVVQLSSVHPSNDTRIFYKICRSLAQAGYSVDLIIQHPKNEIREGINIIALPLAKKKSDRILKIIPRLLKQSLKYKKTTIFHFHDPELIPIGLILKLRGYKVIYDVHEDVPKDILTKEWITPRIRKLISIVFKKFEEWAVTKFDRTITVVPDIQERLGAGNAIEIRNYPIVDIKRVDKELPKTKDDYIIYVGSLTIRRGIPLLIDALEYIKDLDFKFYIGGSFNEPGLESLLKSKPGWEKVKFLGWVEQDNLSSLLSSAKVGMVVLGDIPSHRGSFPVKMFEYMYSGIPIIASNFPLWREIVQDCGILVDPKEPAEIAEAINWIFSNPVKAKEMGKKGRQLVLEKYNWANEEKKLSSLYRELFIS